MRVAFISNAYESMGFENLSAVLKKAGHEVRLFMDPELFNDSDTTISPLGRFFDFKPQLLADLKPFKPDLVAFSVITDSFLWAADLARRIKKEMNVPIIFGGIHATSSPDSVIANDCIDMVCLGEGEYAMLDLVESMARGETDLSIKNIWFKRDGKIIKNDLRPLIEDLDTLPLADKNLYYSVSPHFRFCYYTLTNRGCPHACSYCIHSYFRKLYRGKGTYCRQRSVSHVIQELVQAKRLYNISLVRFMDDCFPSEPGWLNEFKEKYAQEVGLPFLCYLYPCQVTTEVLETLQASGCVEINLGIQSWDENVRKKVLHRMEDNKTLEKLLDICSRFKFSYVLDIISGIPGENIDSLFEFLQMCRAKRFLSVNFYWLKYYPAVTITEEAYKNGVITCEQVSKTAEGKLGRNFAVGGDTENADSKKLYLFFLVCRYLPARTARWLYQRKAYRYMPGFVPLRILYFFWNFPANNYELKYIHKMQTFYYRHFILTRLKQHLGQAWCSLKKCARCLFPNQGAQRLVQNEDRPAGEKAKPTLKS
ncbi:MAG TPA: cobalamin-dependent protein [Candidatus Omnitrophota bacterium]|nr:cobalamin-dependent protein [Candidatus Omnitrophota bacterium]HQO58541.1 cobalamin-dependent protein [Candidatus Omnitrophota bacterium]